MLFLISAAAATTLAGVQLVPTLRAGGHTLYLASCGVRDTLWIDHYVAALYVPHGASPGAAKDAGRAKAVVLSIVEARYLPEQIPEKWRAALNGELEREPMARVRQAYGRLSNADVVTFTYLPEQGVTMRVNGTQVMQSPGHVVIDSILDAWAEGDPVSGKLQRLALKHPC